LSNIRQKKIPIAVASSSSLLFINRALIQIKVKKYIKKIISGESVPKGKPEPDIFIEMAKLLQVNPSQCLVIEDSKNGVRAAKKAGMKVIGYQNINSGEQDLSEANLIVSDYANLDINQILMEEFI
ncbi:MAG: HAD-IA family hydrolase, partial [Treponema sp.]|nr:HAD-IA family hydrolase [Treponema sp.]